MADYEEGALAIKEPELRTVGFICHHLSEKYSHILTNPVYNEIVLEYLRLFERAAVAKPLKD